MRYAAVLLVADEEDGPLTVEALSLILNRGRGRRLSHKLSLLES